MLDTIRAIETPEGVTIELRLAGPVPRALAWGIDFAIRVVLYMIVASVVLRFGKLGQGILLITVFLLEWFYPVFFEVYRNGATPGKQALNLAVVQDDGIPVGWSASMVRNLLRTADLLPFLYGCGLLSMMLNRDFKRLGDIAARTVVVYRDRARPLPKLPEATPRHPPLPLTASEQQALIAFAARTRRLTVERAEELAQIVAALGGPSPAGLPELLGYARYIAGER
jgi:uncharacterized RDD family membrane protein YckC